MEKCYAYLRVSSQSQAGDKKDGYPRQLQTIREYAKVHNLQIVEVFKEDVSGTLDESQRPKFKEMISSILSNGVRMIVVESLDRLARSVSVQDQLLIYLASKGIALINARTELNVTEDYQADPMKRAMIQMQGVFSELEKNQIVRRLWAGRVRKRQRGGRAEGRIGYRDTPEGKELVKRIELLRRKKKYGRRRTLRGIAEILNGEGIQTKTGKMWTEFHVSMALHPPNPKTRKS